MTNMAIGFPCYSDPSVSYVPTLAGGSWAAALPLSNLQTTALAQVARSSNATLQATRFNVDLGTSRAVGMIALVKHNHSTTAKVRVLGKLQTFLFDYEAGDDISQIGGTFTRALTATYLDRNGVLRTAASGELRDGHFIGGVRHTLLEAAGTNYLTYSNTFNNGAWGPNGTAGMTVGTGIDDPAGGTAAYSLTALGANAQWIQVVGGLASLKRTSAIWMRRRTGTGTVSIITPDGFLTVVVPTAAWQRFSTVGTAAGTFAQGLVKLATSGDAVDVYNAQCEDGTIATSDIITTTVAVTRPADALSFTYTPVPQAMTVEVKFTESGTLSAGLNLLSIENSASAAPLLYVDSNGAEYRAIHNNGSATVVSGANTGPTAGVSTEIRALVNSNGSVDIGQSLAGAAEVLGGVTAANTLSGAWSATTLLFLNQRGAGTNGINAFQYVRIMAGVQTMATMRASMYDSGWVNGWPSGLSLEDADGLNVPFILIPATAQSARYWSVQISDEANAAGYVQIGRLMITGILQPTVNMLTGAKIGLDTDTQGKNTDGGQTIFNVKPVRRSADFVLDQEPESEAQGTFWKFQRLVGKHGQFLFVFATDDTTYLHERGFPATLEVLGGVEYPYVIARNRTPYRVREIL